MSYKQILLGTILGLGLWFSPTQATADEPQHEAHATEIAEDAHAEEEGFNAMEMILHHIADAHSWHLWGEGHDAVSISLPVILYTDNGIVTFSSSAFHHDTEGKVVVEKNGQSFVNVHEHIYYANAEADSHGSFASHDAEGKITNAAPLDFSLTKNVCSMFLSIIILLLIFLSVAKNYKKGDGVPRGLAGFIEPIILFVRDEIARPNIQGEKYKRYMPYLLTVFFFIWINNLLGLIPILAPNLTGNIAVTLVLAVFTFLITTFSGNKHYWGHIFNTPGVPWWLKIPIPLMPLVEFIGTLTKPFALMIRLFANISAGHILLLSLVSLIFIFESTAMSALSIPFMVFMNVLELLVAALQAYIFTLLSALFIGMATEEAHH